MIDKIINIVCDVFEEDRSKVMNKGARSESMDARRVITKILHDKGYTFQKITDIYAERGLKYKTHVPVWHQNKTAREFIGTDKRFTSVHDIIVTKLGYDNLRYTPIEEENHMLTRMILRLKTIPEDKLGELDNRIKTYIKVNC